jgi:hypothetical protein
MPATGLSECNLLLRLKSVTASATVQFFPAWQFATTDTDHPDDWIKYNDSGSNFPITDDGAACTGMLDSVDSFDSAGKFFVRFGVAVQNSANDGTWYQGEAELWVSARD